MTRFFGGLVLAVAAFSAGASPYGRDAIPVVYDGVRGFIEGLIGGPIDPPVGLPLLNAYEKNLLDDKVLIGEQRVVVRDVISVAEEKRRGYKASQKATEENAIRYRNALVAAEMNGNDEVVIDRLVFDLDQMRSQIDVLLVAHDSFEVAGKSLSDLIAQGAERERELVASLAAVEHALDRIPLQRAIVVSDGATARSAAIIAELAEVHKKVGYILHRANWLLTPEEIENLRQSTAASEKAPRDSKRLEAFLNGDDVFAGTN